MSDPLILPVRSVSPEGIRAILVTLDLGGQPFIFRAGQAVDLGTPDQPVRKPYSIASSPRAAASGDRLEFLVQTGHHGDAGEHLQRLAPGTLVEVSAPFGRFVLPDDPSERRFLFIGGGTGIAPLRSMWLEALERELTDQVTVVYSARSPDEFAFQPELRRLARDGRLRLHLTVTRDVDEGWKGDRGRISLAQLAGADIHPSALCFVCGPAALLADVPGFLRQLGMPAERIRTEEY